ncbi:MAG: phytanoyl-CoA dioxygenase family protein, partial [Chitinophagales bacterium]
MIKFKNSRLHTKFIKDGYVKFDFLNNLQVQKLRDLYFDHKEEHLVVKNMMHSTTDTFNVDLILKLDEKIKNILVPKLSDILHEYDHILSTFMVKESGDNSQTSYHQDPTLVDSNEYMSANIWVALQDTNSENGNLCVVKGSHRITDCLVVTPDFPWFFNKFKDQIPEYSTEIPVKSGQAIIFDNKLIHGATPNHSGKERIAVVLPIKSKQAKWNFYYLEPGNPESKIERYAFDTKSFAEL